MTEDFTPIIDINDFTVSDNVVDDNQQNQDQIDPNQNNDPQNNPEVIEPVIENPDDQGEQNENVENQDDDIEVLNGAVKVLSHKGLITLGKDEEIKSWDDLDQKFEQLPTQIAQSIVASVPEIGQSLIDFVITKGDNLTKDDLKSFYDTYMDDIDRRTREVDLSTIELSRNYLKEYYTKLGINEVAVEGMLNSLEDKEDEGKALIAEATKVNEAEKQINNSSSKLQDAKKEQAELDAKNKQFASSVKQELNNLGWRSERLRLVANHISTGKANQILSNAAYSSPKALIQLANLSTYWDEKSGEFDLNAFAEQMLSKKLQTVQNNIIKDSFSSVSSKTSTNTVKDTKKNPFEGLTPVF